MGVRVSLRGPMKTYNGNITNLRENQIFVFGSNKEGRHGKGSALFARQHCGAVYGVPMGLQGQSYAIITKDLTKPVHPSIGKDFITEQIRELYSYARKNPELEFLIAYSGNGKNLNGYTSEEMAGMFACMAPPENIIFEDKFADLVFNYLKVCGLS